MDTLLSSGPVRRCVRATGIATLLVATLGLAACGSDADDKADAPGTTVTPTPSPTSDGEVAHTEVASFTDTRIKVREASGELVPLSSSDDVKAWLAPQQAPATLIQDVQKAVERTSDESLHGTVLWVGCDKPEDYSVVRTDGELEVRVSPPKQQSQCLAPMTWLALVSVG